MKNNTTPFDTDHKVTIMDEGGFSHEYSYNIAVGKERTASRRKKKLIINYPPIEEGTVNILTGDPGTAKTIIAVSIANTCAKGGCDESGIICRHGPMDTAILYAEDKSGTLDREVAWEEKFNNGAALPNVANIYCTGIKLTNSIDMEAAINMVRDTKLNIKLLVIDNLQLFYEGDENSNPGINKLFDSLEYMSRQLDTAILLVHHNGKSKVSDSIMSRMRGGSALLGRASTVIELTIGGKTR